MEPSPNSWNLVVKVKYGDTLKRFGASVYGDSVDLNMINLRTKIVILFKLKPDAHFALSYVDEDGDVVSLDTDDELCDAAISQRLNPLRINVQLLSDTLPEPGLKTDSNSSGTANPQQSEKVHHINSAVDDALNSIPEPFRGAFSKVYHESVSKAVPAVAEIVDLVSKLAVSAVAKPPTGESSGETTQTDVKIGKETEEVNASGVPVKTYEQFPKQANDEGPVSKTEVHIPIDINKSTTELPGNPSFPGYPSVDDLLAPPYLSGNMTSQDKGKSPLDHTKEPDIAAASNSVPPQLVGERHADTFKPYGLGAWAADRNKRNLHFGTMASNIGFGGGAIPRYWGPGAALPELPFPPSCFPPIGGHPYKRAGPAIHDAMLRTFHKGVRCDGCGMYPIIGTRFKSHVKENYDLCNWCFMETGKEEDYERIERANPTPLRPHRENAHSRHRVPTTFIHGVGGKLTKGKLESRFIQDVTILDGTLMPPSTPFTKIWRMRNNGTVQWPYGTQLVWVGGDQISTHSSVNLAIPYTGLPIDQEIDIAIDFVSPSMPGRYVSYWRLASPSGQKFGQRVWVLIQVENTRAEFPSSNWFTGLNLNLPPESSYQNVSAPIGDMGDHTDFLGTTPLKPEPDAVPNELPGSLTNPVQVETQPATSDAVPHSLPAVVPKVSYPIIDLTESQPGTPKAVAAAATSSKVVTEEDAVEQTLLKELESMGFKQIDLNKEVLRLNDYNLEQSLDDLCGYAEWEPLLSELKEMGFSDKEKNKKLLIKHGGSIKRVVMELVTEEIA